jgi:hypothetical protein
MPIVKKNDVMPERPIITVIYGVPGSGKTSVATTAENPLIIDCDRGYDRAVQRVDTVLANTWYDVLNEEQNFKGYKTIVCDTAKSILDDYIQQYVIDANYKLKTNSLKRFGAMGDEFKNFISRLRSLGIDLVFICHDKETAEGDVIKHYPDCTGQSKDLLLRIADQVGYISLINGKRHICFEPDDTHVGKNVAQIPLTEIPDATEAEFSTFMANIIKQVKTAIQNKSEAQRKANELLASLRDELDTVTNDKDAANLLTKCAELPQVLKRPFFGEVQKVLAEKGFVYSDGKFKKGKTKQEKENAE